MKRLFFLFSLLLINFVGLAQNYQLHAVYIYSFIRYVQWPSSSEEGDFVIGIVGDSPIIDELERMAAAKKAGTRDIQVKKYTNLNGLDKADIVFISKNYTDDISGILNKVGSANTLLITEKEGLGVQGSNINFVNKNGKLAFELNRSAMDRADLKVSSELTRLAILI
ncbi:YfiR family protein [Fulvivirga sediminis]|uniref:YfiR family protein n=1 Tax=Fulvivirga sediminis TaxID=2803949 RepID=A0A937F7G1_9BACT|nr:YfiR family protein [Fulvivirga sediminis]MBL3655725.1 YfiR family protein [Fulvivirga sediminis]